MTKQKHLTLSQRLMIERGLNNRESFKAIARKCGKDCTTIAKEIKSRMQYKQTGAYGRPFNNCRFRRDCSRTAGELNLPAPKKQARFTGKCHLFCSDYQPESCPLLEKAPYVCNGCPSHYRCILEKRLYEAEAGQKDYRAVLSETRVGIAASSEEITVLDKILSPHLQQGQSLHHICVANANRLFLSERCLYNYVAAGVLTTRNLDMPRVVRFRPRRPKRDPHKIDRKCRQGRTYPDFNHFLQENDFPAIAEMDSVEGQGAAK